MKIKVLFLVVCALGSTANAMDSPSPIKNKIIPLCEPILDTIQSDLGLGKQSSVSHDNSTKSLVNHLATGSRLYLYQLMASRLMYTLLSTAVSFEGMSSQFDTLPSFTSTVITGPILEEIAYSYILGGGLGPYKMLGDGELSSYAKIFVPLLFGWSHYHKDPKTRLLIGMKAAIGSFIKIQHIHANPSSYAPFFEHMINNFVGWCLQRYSRKA